MPPRLPLSNVARIPEIQFTPVQDSTGAAIAQVGSSIVQIGQQVADVEQRTSVLRDSSEIARRKSKYRNGVNQIKAALQKEPDPDTHLRQFQVAIAGLRKQIVDNGSNDRVKSALTQDIEALEVTSVDHERRVQNHLVVTQHRADIQQEIFEAQQDAGTTFDIVETAGGPMRIPKSLDEMDASLGTVVGRIRLLGSMGIFDAEEAGNLERSTISGIVSARIRGEIRDNPGASLQEIEAGQFFIGMPGEEQDVFKTLLPGVPETLLEYARSETTRQQTAARADAKAQDKLIKQLRGEKYSNLEGRMIDVSDNDGDLDQFSDELTKNEATLGQVLTSKGRALLRRLKKAGPDIKTDPDIYGELNITILKMGSPGEADEVILDIVTTEGVSRTDMKALIGDTRRRSIVLRDKAEQTRMTVINESATFIKGLIGEDISLVASFDKSAKRLEAIAIFEFRTRAATEKGPSGALLTSSEIRALAGDIIQKTASQLENLAGTPEQILATLPFSKGARLDTPELIMQALNDGDIQRPEADVSLNKLKFVESQQQRLTAGKKTALVPETDIQDILKKSRR